VLPVGTGAKSDVVADFVAFSRAKGVYAGVNFDGTLVNLSDEWNEAYYGKKVLPPDILVRASVHNAAADALLVEWLASVFAIDARGLPPLALAARATLSALVGGVLFALVDRRLSWSRP